MLLFADVNFNSNGELKSFCPPPIWIKVQNI